MERVHEATGSLSSSIRSMAGSAAMARKSCFAGPACCPARATSRSSPRMRTRQPLDPRSIWYRRLEVARVVFVRPHLRFVITADGRIRMVGQSALQRSDADQEPLTLERLPRGRFAVTDAVLEVLDLRARQGRFQLTGADVEVVREGDDITATARVDLPEHLGAAIDVEAKAGGDLADSAAVDLAGPGRCARLDLGNGRRCCRTASAFLRPGTDRPRLRARPGTCTASSLRLPPQLEGLRLPGSALLLPRCRDIRLQRDDSTISIEATDFELSQPGMPWRTARLEARLTRKDGRVRCRGRTRRLRPHRESCGAGRGAPGRHAAGADRDAGPARRVARHRPDGHRRRRAAAAGRRRSPRFLRRRVRAVGDRSRRHGLRRQPRGRGGGGIVTLATRDATIDWPQRLRAPIPVLRGDGRVEWQRFDTGVRLWLDDAFGDSGHGSARGKLRMVLRPGELPLLDLPATAAGFDVTQTWRYLRTDKLSPKAIGWLDTAFRARRVTTARVSITGRPRDFRTVKGREISRDRPRARREPPLRERMA